jgi:hypothetical protein
MVRFYTGTELSKRLQVPLKEKERHHKYIIELIEYIYLLLNSEDISKTFNYPLFKMGLRLKELGAKREEIEKALRYHLLSSDYRGSKFIENLFSIEAFFSYLDHEHPKYTYHKLISYLGEEFVFSNQLPYERDAYFLNKAIQVESLLIDNSILLPKEYEDLNLITNLTPIQMEYLFFDLNPIFIASGLYNFPYQIQMKLISFLPFEVQQMTLYHLIEKTGDKITNLDLLDYILARMRGNEKNSFELRRYHQYHNRLYRGEELSYRLNASPKSKIQLKEILIILLGVSGKIREVGFISSKEILSYFSMEDLSFLKLGLQYVIEGWHPINIRFVLENYILSGDLKGIDFLKRYIILDGCCSLAMNISEFVFLEKSIQTIGTEHRDEIEKYLNDTLDLNVGN